MKTYVTFGAISTVASALFMLIMFFCGFQTDKMEAGQPLNWLGMLIPIAVLYFGMKEVRDANGAKGLSYGSAVFVAFMISVFSGLFGAVYTYIHFTFVNPDFAQYASDLARKKMEASNVPAAQIENAVSMQMKFMTPIVQAITSVLVGPIFGTIIGLVVAIFVKRDPVEDLSETAQPPVVNP